MLLADADCRCYGAFHVAGGRRGHHLCGACQGQPHGSFQAQCSALSGGGFGADAVPVK